ncbi:MAG: discoidin domain-containing protein [Armatimonadota bacterium]
MKTFLLTTVFLLSINLAGAEPRVVSAKYASEDIPIAEYIVTDAQYKADATGKQDVTPLIQGIIDEANRKGGGVIFFPAGTYRFDGSIRLKQGVTLRGEWKNPKETKGRVVGTIFAVYGGKGKEKSAPFILMEKVSCIANLSFWYPEQKPEKIVPYPWTIDVTDQASCGYTVRNVNFVNSYKALSNGADTKTCHNVAYYSNLYGCPLKEGIWVEWVLDITRVDRVFFSPDYWKNSGLPNAPVTKNAEKSLRDFMYKNATAVTSRRFDWFPLYVADLDGYGVGIRITQGEQGGANGEMYGVNISNGRIGILAEAAQPCGWTITNCNITTLDKPDAFALLVKSSVNMVPFMFNSCKLGKVVVEDKSRSALSFENCSFTDNLSARSGDISMINSKFADGKKAHFYNANNDVMIDSTVPYSSRGNNVRVVNAPDVVQSEYNPHPFAPFRRPATKKVFSVREFGAKGDGVTDDTAAFKKAIESAGVSGGTVYVSAGKYPIREPLTIPTGVELRGIFEGPTHIMVPGSIIFVETGDGEENGTPFISLSENSGIRGMNFWYPKQNIDNPVPYPWIIRALGKNCYVRDSALGQPWQALDFASAADTSGHSIAGVTAAALRRGIFVDNAPKGGTVEGIQLVVHYWDRNDSGLPTTGTPVNSGMPDANVFMKKQTENFMFGNCTGERIFSTFGYSSHAGLTLNKNFDGIIHQHGSDGTSCGVKIYDNAKAVLVNTLVAPVSPMILYSNAKLLNPDNLKSQTGSQLGIYVDESFKGNVQFINSSTWGFGQSMQLNGTGQIDISQITTMLAQSAITNPNARVSSAYSFFGHILSWRNGKTPDPSSVFGYADNSTPDFKGDNVSFSAKVTSSTRVSDGQGPQCATDGASASLFASLNTTDPTWVEVDLAKLYNITGIEIMHTGKAGEAILNTRDFALSGRNDDSQEWQVIDTRKGNKDFITSHPAKGEFRYIRMDITKANGTENDNHTRIKEISVFGY